MGYKYLNQCFETKQEFLDYVAQGCFAQNGGSGALSSYMITCSSNSDNITIQPVLISNGTMPAPYTFTPQIISCTFQPPKIFSNADVVELSWLVVGVWVVAWGIRKITDSFKTS